MNWLEKADMNIVMSNFFGIDVQHNNLITLEERVKFKIFLTHVSKRLINAYISKYGLADLSSSLEPKIEKDIEGFEVETERTPEQAFEDVIKKFLSEIAMHDMSHSITFLNTEDNISNKIFTRADNSVVPEFLKAENGEEALADKELIRQELFAFMWQTVIADKKPSPLIFLEEKDIKDLLAFFGRQLRVLSKTNKIEANNIKRALKCGSKSLEGYINAYYVLVFLIIEGQNDIDARRYAMRKFLPNQEDLDSPDNDEDWPKVREFVASKEKLTGAHFKALLSSRDPKITEMLTYIWNNRKNKRVLVDLFFKTTSKYFENLERRYEVKK